MNGAPQWNDLDPGIFPTVTSFGEDVSHTAVFGIRDADRGGYGPMCVIVDSGVTCIRDSAFGDADSCAGEWGPVDEEPYLVEEYDRVRWGDVECSYREGELTCTRADESQYFVLPHGRIVETEPNMTEPG